MLAADRRAKKKGSSFDFPLLYGIWSGRRVSNSRPQPWQGCALPTELLPHLRTHFLNPDGFDGAGDESRTRDLNLGKVALYQLSYSRFVFCEGFEFYMTEEVCQELPSRKLRCASRRRPDGPERAPHRARLEKMVPETGVEPVRPRAADFKSATSTSFVIPAPVQVNKKGEPNVPPLAMFWSGRRVSNSRPQPWQGCALPTELLPQEFKLFGGARRNRTAVNGFAIRCMATLLSRHPFLNGAGDESRTRDLNLGKVALYQLSYSRAEKWNCTDGGRSVKGFRATFARPPLIRARLRRPAPGRPAAI